MSRKGQALLLEFFIAATLFSATLAYFHAEWHRETVSRNQVLSRLDSQAEAFAASELLVRGFAAERPHELNSSALAEFGSLSYSDSKKRLGLSRNYSLSVDYANGSQIMRKGGVSRGAAIRRCALLQGEIVFLTVVYDG